jgi:hypothetical protein
MSGSMTCREFDDVVHAFVRMELLDLTLRERALDHAARCANCSERMAEAGALAEATETVGKGLEEQQAPPRVEAAVMAAFRNHHRRATWRRRFEWAAMGTAAALALVFLWSTAGPSRGQFSPSPRKGVSSQPIEPVDAQAIAPSQPNEIAPVAETEDADVVTGEDVASENFVPLPFTDEIGPEDLGMVVRVQLTRASLAELGYPVVESSDDDLILADVLVGEDGWPRAVKLVQ